MVALTSFMSRLLPNVLGCPEPVALQALLDSAIEFCNTSLAVVHTTDPVTQPVGMPSFEIETPSQTRVAQVMNIWFSGSNLYPVPAFEVTDLTLRTGTPLYYLGQEIDETFSVTMLPAPDRLVTNGVVARVALSPTRTATQVPSALYDRYADAILAGAQSILHGYQDQPYSNDQKAVLMARIARSKANSARIDALHGRVVSSMSVNLRAF